MEERESGVDKKDFADLRNLLDPKSKTKSGRYRPLHQRLDDRHLMKIHEVFLAEQGHMLTPEQLKKALSDVADITLPDQDFNILFLKISTKSEGLVDWDEFISHLLIGFKDAGVTTDLASLEAPISRLPKNLKSNHRHPICRITFSPATVHDGYVDYTTGSYVTVSKDGVINFWSLDMDLERSVISTSPELKVKQTWVTDLVCMPDVQVICTSSSERDLRFFDTTAGKFELRVHIVSLPYPVIRMHYAFVEDQDEEQKLVLGDSGGSVAVLLFPARARGPFRSQLGVPIRRARWEDVVQNEVHLMRAVEFRHVHTDWVKQVGFYQSLHCVVSCANCPKRSMIVRDISGKTSYTYRVPKGFSCFAISNKAHLVATGGSDCMVRLWNPFVPKRPSVVLPGHHAGVVALVLQDKGTRLCSIGQDKCVKVWDLTTQTCIQTFLQLPADLGERTQLSVFYNPNSRQVFIGSMRIAVFILSELLNPEHTDGNTHSRGVSIVLWNPLFKSIITCGLDSWILVWDPYTGRRMSVIKGAHTHTRHGEVIPIEITAATFDPGLQLLCTGASDGSLKVWNFNTGTCSRNMAIEEGCEVTGIVWLPSRILAVGWNKHITEFADIGGYGGLFCKAWETVHTEDVLATAARTPHTFATSSYNGELVLWRLETGQPYKRYDISNPMGKIKLTFKKETAPKPKAQSIRQSVANIRARAASIFKGTAPGAKPPLPPVDRSPRLSGPMPATKEQAKARRISVIQMPGSCVSVRTLAVHCMIFLQTRPMAAEVGSLIVSIENGALQMWSHHPGGGFLASFSAIHTAGDYVISLATDSQNEYLFTGHTAGYIKVWLMKNFCIGPEPIHICMPYYRLKFPFLLNDLFVGRAKRAVRGQAQPTLLSSHRAHTYPVSSLQYIEESQIVVSGSADYSARLWTLGGRYVGTLGTFRKWIDMVPDMPPEEADLNIVAPPEIKRIASSTTMKVLLGGKVTRRLTRKQEQAEAEHEMPQAEIRRLVYGKPADDPILGHYFELPPRSKLHFDVILDKTLQFVPVYRNLIVAEPELIRRPSTPEIVKALRLSKQKRPKVQVDALSKTRPRSKSQSQVQ